MNSEPMPLVFDSGPLSHFEKAGWFGLLKRLSAECGAVVPDTVISEMERGAGGHPHLKTILEADWYRVESVDGDSELEAFARYAERLVVSGSTKNMGECGVLALAEVRGYRAVLDDRVARRAAESANLELTGSIALLVAAVNSHDFSLDIASSIADDILLTDYRLPFKQGGFKEWVLDKRLVEPK